MFRIIKLAPSGHISTSWLSHLEALIMILVPNCAPFARVRSSTWAMAAIEASASPRKPIVWSENKSSAFDILEVLCRSKANRASVSVMPLPLSITCMSVLPASFSTIWMLVAPASMAFSTSSLITEAGRWITSPAAIWLATESGSNLMISLIFSLGMKKKIIH